MAEWLAFFVDYNPSALLKVYSSSWHATHRELMCTILSYQGIAEVDELGCPVFINSN